MIQIDDAGSGSLIGGTCIGAIRIESNEFVYDFIPVEYYREQAFKEKKYIEKCTEIVISLLNKLNVKRTEEISICQGYMFDNTREAFNKLGYKYINTKIGSPLQERIETAFKDYALELGLPIQYVKYTKYPLHFHRILRWVYADYENRYLLCKTGWKSWKKHGKLELTIYVDTIYNNDYFCLKCGKHIEKHSKVKVIKYISNCPNTIFIHNSCQGYIANKEQLPTIK